MLDKEKQISILGGTGDLGSGLASRLLKSGFKVIIGSRTMKKAKKAEQSLGSNVVGMLNQAAASCGDIVILTVPFAYQKSIVEECKNSLKGKLFIDTTVPLIPPKVSTVSLPMEGSAAQISQNILGEEVNVVSAFQNVSAELLLSSREIECEVLVCGDKKKSRQEVIHLINSIGMKGWHAGPLANSAAVEGMTSVLISINKHHSIYHSGIKVTGLKDWTLKNLQLIAIEGIPLIEPGDNLAKIIIQAVKEQKIKLKSGDILVIAQKIVSKSENRYAYLKEVIPSSEAFRIAKKTEKDPKLVQLILNESARVIRYKKGLMIVENKLGFVHANAGIDKSNIEINNDNPKVLLLPKNPDGSALSIKKGIFRKIELNLGIIINDSSGRAWRKGIVGIAIGSSGVEALSDLRGKTDLYGNTLEITEVGKADEIASAASLLMGQADEGFPVILVKGITASNEVSDVKSLLRDQSEDLFR